MHNAVKRNVDLSKTGVSHSNLAAIQCVSGFFLCSLIELAVVVYFSVKMSRYSVYERIFIVRTYYPNNNSPTVIQRKFEIESKLKIAGLSVSTIHR